MSRNLKFIVFLMFFVTAFMASLLVGQYKVSISDALLSIIHYDSTSIEQVIVVTSRIPRAIIATFVGAALAIAGVLMQALTRNPMASPGILGINGGALFFIVLAMTLLQVSSMQYIVWLGFFGAALAAGIVYSLGSIGRDGMTPTKVVLAGAALTALFVSFTQALLIVNQNSLDNILFWLAGSVANRSLEAFFPIMPYISLAIIISCFMGKAINLSMSGDDVAKGLGQRTLYIKLTMVMLVACLAGGSVAVAGNIAFIGLIVPHIIRLLVTTDHRWLIPLSGLCGASLLLISDSISRVIIMPEELPVGVITAMLGTPLFIILARRGLNHE